jgi:hypothetical protein
MTAKPDPLAARPRDASTVDGRSPEFRRDIEPMRDGVRMYGGSRDLTPREAALLAVAFWEFGGHFVTADAISATCERWDVPEEIDRTLRALQRLCGRGLLACDPESPHVFRLTRPQGRDLARRLAADPSKE